MIKFSADLELGWLKPVGPTTSNYNGFMEMTQTPDGHYLAAGERTAYGALTQPSNGDWGGWLFKFTELGDSLWARADNAPPGNMTTGEFVYGGVGLLSSGNIVAGGRGDVDNKAVGWVVKVTADGCLDTVFCQTSFTHESAENTLSLFPNPVVNWVSINAPNESTHGKLELYNLNGRLCWAKSGLSNEKFNILDVPNGMYLCRFIAHNGKLFYGKLVVQK